MHQALGRLLPLAAGDSAFLNNTLLVAMLVPVVGDVGRFRNTALGSLESVYLR
jgi:hypothetical protein